MSRDGCELDKAVRGERRGVDFGDARRDEEPGNVAEGFPVRLARARECASTAAASTFGLAAISCAMTRPRSGSILSFDSSSPLIGAPAGIVPYSEGSRSRGPALSLPSGPGSIPWLRKCSTACSRLMGECSE
jgi:hypothetical protein